SVPHSAASRATSSNFNRKQRPTKARHRLESNRYRPLLENWRITMTSIAASVSQVRRTAVVGEVSLVRLYVLRATYLLLVIGLGAVNLPELVRHGPTARGVIPSLLGGIWLLAFVGLRYPLQMLPLLLF